MPRTNTTFQLAQWFLTPAEISVLSLAALVIWIAKWQDAHFPATANTARERPAKAYVPTGRYREGGVLPTEIASRSDSSNTEKNFDAPVPERIASDEAKRFFERFSEHQKLKFSGKKLTEQQWASLLKNAGVTFAFVEGVFQDAAGTPGRALIASEILQDPTAASAIFEAVEARFGIPASELRRFARKKQASLAEWAFFIEQRQR